MRMYMKISKNLRDVRRHTLVCLAIKDCHGADPATLLLP